MTKTKEQQLMINRIENVLSKPLDYYTTDNIDSIKGLMETMLNVNTDDKPITEKETDLMNLMQLVQQSKNYTIKQLANHMWTTVGQYYLFLEDIKNDNYKNIHLITEETQPTKNINTEDNHND